MYTLAAIANGYANDDPLCVNGHFGECGQSYETAAALIHSASDVQRSANRSDLMKA